MNTEYHMNVNSRVKQKNDHLSFIGGKPILPQGTPVPTCMLCGSQQTFFFQVEFPADHVWSSYVLAMFACTCCSDIEHALPPRYGERFEHPHISLETLKDHQKNFRTLVFPAKDVVLVESYEEKVIYRKIILKPSLKTGGKRNKVSGDPYGYIEDDTPGSIEGEEPVFLLQILEDYKFPIHPSAPKYDVCVPYYHIFLGNAIYFFGPSYPDESLVYTVTQAM